MKEETGSIPRFTDFPEMEPLMWILIGKLRKIRKNN